MSSEIIAADVVAASRNDARAAVAKAHAARLRGLHAVTKFLANNATLASLVGVQYDHDDTSPTDTDAAKWLHQNALISGHYFNDASLPYPILLPCDASSPLHDTQAVLTSPSRQPSVPANADGHTPEATLKAPLLAPPRAVSSPIRSRKTVSRSASPGVRPAAVASPSPEEAASLSDATKALLDSQVPHRPARTVHLPPESVQTEKMRERREALDDEKAKSESDHLRQSRMFPQNEMASSPGSTVGALSAATPMPPQDSPDTSPDSEAADLDVLPPKDLMPTPQEQHAQEEHDSLLAAQKDIARRQARGDDADPDEQLKWEEREAAAREATKSAARENGPDVDKVDGETEAKQAMDDVQMMEEIQPSEEASASNTTRQSATTDAKSPTASSETDPSSLLKGEETIAVLPRSKVLPPLDTAMQWRAGTRTLEQLTQVSAVPERRNTRISTGAILQRSVSQIIADASATDQHDRKHVLSPESVVSPMTLRHPQDSRTLRTPQRPARSLTLSHVPDDAVNLTELAPLKGAADDPERDYLEPLFRIQAHDSPNGPTKALPSLVKDAAKYLSTQDQFATLQERLDHKILRRIYQLQNANKWSLRQMERCKEPEQPITHMDHMMAEMKWMQKDFRAERKMKKSICAWLATRCAEWVTANTSDRRAMQVTTKKRIESAVVDNVDHLPELETSGESAPEDDASPPTPQDEDAFPSVLVVPPELSDLVAELEMSGSLGKALKQLPVTGLSHFAAKSHRPRPMAIVSKFVEGKVLPRAAGPIRKRSRFEYEDDSTVLNAEPGSKRLRVERTLVSEDEDVALFHPDNKHIRDRLHANNAFRPPSEFVMPSTSFYEFRNGSQWIWEDDQKLRKLAKEYSFNWSLIADEMTLPSQYKSAAERRTPWECFERWVELETLPAEMRKTMYFKTWFARLEQSQQAAERRYQAHVATIQQAANGAQTPVPMRRRTVPSRVEKRKNTRYLWLVDAMRKHARKRENNAYKQAETQRAAAQRKAQADINIQPRGGPMPTPQEFSRKRHEHDLQLQEHQRQQRQKLIEAQQKQVMMARRAQQGGMPGVPGQQPRTGPTNLQQPNGQMPGKGPQPASMNGQVPQQTRPSLPMATHNGHLAVPQLNAQGVPQAQMRASANGNLPQQGIANMNAQAGQYGNQQYQNANGTTPSPGGGMATQQHIQASQQMLAQMSAQNVQNANGRPNVNGNSTGQPMSNSPSMPPPPTPHGVPQQLSSGHVPALFAIKNQLKSRHPTMAEDQLNTMATSELRRQSQNQTSTDARQSAMNAAAGIPATGHSNNMQAYNHNQGAFQGNHQMSGSNPAYMSGDNATPQPNLNSQSPQAQQNYAAQMRARQLQQMRLQGSPSGSHAVLNGSPGVSHASSSMAPASPSMQYSNMNGVNQRPPSRSNTPQMQRLGSSGMASGMQSPGAQGLPTQGSPHGIQASMAR